MDRVLGILSLFAGVLIAGTFVATGLSQPESADAISRHLAQSGWQLHMDPLSFVFGIVAGVGLCQLARICWIEIPRLAMVWLQQNMVRLGYLGTCVALVVVLIYI